MRCLGRCTVQFPRSQLWISHDRYALENMLEEQTIVNSLNAHVAFVVSNPIVNCTPTQFWYLNYHTFKECDKLNHHLYRCWHIFCNDCKSVQISLLLESAATSSKNSDSVSKQACWGSNDATNMFDISHGSIQMFSFCPLYISYLDLKTYNIPKSHSVVLKLSVVFIGNCIYINEAL